MYQASNRWEEALQVAHTKDRINLKRTYYDYARYLEGEGMSSLINALYYMCLEHHCIASGKITLAQEMYEKCQTHHFDVPRMLFDDTAALEDYCTSGQDP